MSCQSISAPRYLSPSHSRCSFRIQRSSPCSVVIGAVERNTVGRNSVPFWFASSKPSNPFLPHRLPPLQYRPYLIHNPLSTTSQTFYLLQVLLDPHNLPQSRYKSIAIPSMPFLLDCLLPKNRKIFPVMRPHPRQRRPKYPSRSPPSSILLQRSHFPAQI